MKIIEKLLLMNLMVFIFLWIPAYIRKDQLLMFDVVSFLLLSSNVIIYILLMRSRKPNV